MIQNTYTKFEDLKYYKYYKTQKTNGIKMESHGELLIHIDNTALISYVNRSSNNFVILKGLKTQREKLKYILPFLSKCI